MGTMITTREWQLALSRFGYGRGYTAPLPTSFFVGLLTTGLTLTAASTASNAASGEVAASNGYARQLWGRSVASMASNTLTMTVDHGLAANQRVHVFATTTLFTGLSAATEYFVINPTATTLQLSATSGGSEIALSGGSGTHYIKSGVVYDTGSDNRAEAIDDRVVFTASGGTITYQGYFLMANTTATRGDSTNSILVGYEYFGASQALASGESREIRFSANISDRGNAVGSTS